MLRPLVKATDEHTANGCRARLQLAEHLLLAEPDHLGAWQACGLARCVLAVSSDPEQSRRALGALGLALTLLGHFRAARAAYRDALALDPTDPVCAHNLGHLEIVHFGAVTSGLRWLKVAHLELPDDPEIAASLAHAWVLAGQVERGQRVLERSLGDRDATLSLIAAWQDQAAT